MRYSFYLIGSMTGAPKIRSVDILNSLESHPRGVYSGALGFLGVNGTADFNVVIRTCCVSDDNFTVGAGGAIVALSDGDAEYQEMLLKLNSVLPR